MKKVLLILGLITLSFNSHAMEHVIGFSGGYNFQTSKLRHTITNRYNNPNYDPNNPSGELSTITKFFLQEPTISNKGSNFDLEYQARIKILSLGAGYSSSKTLINLNYQNLDNISYESKIPYFLIMLSLFENNYVGLRLGFTLGAESIKSNYESTIQFNNSFLADTEFKITKHLIVFSRASYQLTTGKNYNFDTNLVFGGADDKNQYENVNITHNNIMITPTNNLLKINFGIRYKL